MSRIEPPPEEEFEPLQDELVERLEDTHGFVPNQHRLDLHLPLVLESLLDLNRRVIFEGNLGPAFLEKLALIVSVENGCDYCVSYHANNYASLLEKRGLGTEELDAIRSGDWREADLDPLQETLVSLALEANDDPRSVTDEDVEEALDAGAEPRDLVQLIHFVNLIAGYNRFNTVFDTEVDDEMGGWMATAEDQ